MSHAVTLLLRPARVTVLRQPALHRRRRLVDLLALGLGSITRRAGHHHHHHHHHPGGLSSEQRPSRGTGQADGDGARVLFAVTVSMADRSKMIPYTAKSTYLATIHLVHTL